jgi:hypothetical protein
MVPKSERSDPPGAGVVPSHRAFVLGSHHKKGMNKRKKVALAKHRHKKRKLKARAQAAR